MGQSFRIPTPDATSEVLDFPEMHTSPNTPHGSELKLPNLAGCSAMDVPTVLQQMRTQETGLTTDDVSRRSDVFGPNIVHTYVVHWPRVLLRQFRSPLLILLAIASMVSFFVGEGTNASIILGIIAMSVGLSFVNEYRAEQATADLHSRIEDRCTV
ncbi:MAG: hypothetical protein EBU85_06780, partial [Actinobacteria bacterium]|nr:hypothetical protein [Actinomycetota bacterium]